LSREDAEAMREHARQARSKRRTPVTVRMAAVAALLAGDREEALHTWIAVRFGRGPAPPG
jgi:hypothetical protein